MYNMRDQGHRMGDDDGLHDEPRTIQNPSNADFLSQDQVEEALLMNQLSGVRAVETTALEQEFGAAMSAALAKQDVELEERRLAKTRERIAQLEDRIRMSRRLGPTRIAKLHDRLDELRAEEAAVLQRIRDGGVCDEGLEEVTVVLPRKRQVVEFSEEESDADKAVEDEELATDGSEEDQVDVEDVEVGSDVDEADEEIEDDFRDEHYRKRLENWKRDNDSDGTWDLTALLDGSPLSEQPISVGPVEEFHGLLVPRLLYDCLLGYQKTGVEWLLGLFSRRTGGILGDEMGLGKTVQVIAWLAALQLSGCLKAPVLVVCPVTLMRQWIRECQYWWPALRVFRLHSSENRQRDMRAVLKKAAASAHVLITSYGHLRQFSPLFAKREWRAVVLDEGHAIRNPEAAITTACKQLRTPHRIILSGTPVQNGLVELWSLIDFCSPGLLGTLPVFKAELAAPIVAGGYVGAGTLQVQTAYRCACVLRELLGGVLLRRVKADVAAELPAKQEHILLCELSEYQRRLYEWILETDIIQSCLAGKRNVLAGIDLLRKVCNDPDLLVSGPLADQPDFPWPRSLVEAIPGKLRILSTTLAMWRQRGHKALLFCQTRQMLDRVEALMDRDCIPYLRMDGTTEVRERAVLVDRFNNDPTIPVFLLTTRVGGLGLNLTGADRVLIYDPDWNPSTDLQARERAWRLGQTRPVTIYRLLAAGTIEEKIYQRQLWKQHLTSRVLTDPKQARFFKATELYDLFTLAPPSENQTETGAMLSGLDVETTRKSDTLADDNQHVLEGLFDALPGLHSAIAHDRLMERSRQETLLVEREAERMARSAAEALLRSRASATAVDEDVEEAGSGRGIKPKSQGLVATSTVPSSAAILAAARARTAKPSTAPPKDTGLDDRLSRVLDRLLRYLASSNGAASSADIALQFRDQLAPGQEPAFRRILKTVATFDSATRSWHIKPDLMQ